MIQALWFCAEQAKNIQKKCVHFLELHYDL